MKHISCVILSFNSAKYLKKVLDSTSFFEEVILLDSGSSDATLEITAGYKNVKIFYQAWLGFGKQKRMGVSMATKPWVFSLDSDEVLTPALKEELLCLDALLEAKKQPPFYLYKVARLNYFFGKPIKRLGLYPDYTVRLFDKSKANFDEREVHESVKSDFKPGKLVNHFEHFAYDSIEQFIQKQNKYSSLNPKKPSTLKAVFSPYFTFFKLYFLKLGFLEGKRGFIIARLYAQYTFWKYIKKLKDF